MTPPRQTKIRLTFLAELADFWRFIMRPTLTPRLPGRDSGTLRERDFRPGVSLKRLLAWALFLWVVNLGIFGPIAALVAGQGDAQHRFDFSNIPWFTAIVWAPLVEEMVFRHGLRRPAQALWLCPLLIPVLWSGPELWSMAVLGAGLILLAWSARSAKRWPMAWLRTYRTGFPWVFHVVTLLFAGMHLGNYSLNQTAYWLLPLLVLPQWVTGLVLGWIRVRRGIGASIALHAIYNTGPVLLVGLWIHFIYPGSAGL